MKPQIWGPTAWNYLHLSSFNYPDNPSDIEKNNSKLFLEYFGKTLPCVKCQNNFQKHIQTFDLNSVLDSKVNYINFIWQLHNKINKDQGKEELPFNDFIKIYKEVLDSEYLNPLQQLKTNKIYRNLLIVLVLIIILLVILGYYKLKVQIR